MADLPPELRAALGRLREEESPSAEIAKRSLLRFADVLARERGHVDESSESAGSMPRPGLCARSLGLFVAVAATIVLLIGLGALGLHVVRSLQESTPVEAPYQSMGSKAPVQKAVPPLTVGDRARGHAPARVERPEKVERLGSKGPHPTRAIRPTVDPTGDRLREELELLRAAKSTGNALEALKLLERHESRFPKSRLSEERDVLRAEVLCKLNRAAEARERANRALRANPSSAFAARLRRVCAEPKILRPK